MKSAERVVGGAVSASRLQSHAPCSVVMLTRGRREPFLRNAAELARLSDNSRNTVVAGAGHEIHLFAPERVIRGDSRRRAGGDWVGSLPDRALGPSALRHARGKQLQSLHDGTAGAVPVAEQPKALTLQIKALPGKPQCSCSQLRASFERAPTFSAQGVTASSIV